MCEAILMDFMALFGVKCRKSHHAFPSGNRNKKLVSVIMKNGSSSLKCILEQNSSITESPKVCVSGVWSVDRNGK